MIDFVCVVMRTMKILYLQVENHPIMYPNKYNFSPVVESPIAWQHCQIIENGESMPPLPPQFQMEYNTFTKTHRQVNINYKNTII